MREREKKGMRRWSKGTKEGRREGGREGGIEKQAGFLTSSSRSMLSWWWLQAS